MIKWIVILIQYELFFLLPSSCIEGATLFQRHKRDAFSEKLTKLENSHTKLKLKQTALGHGFVELRFHKHNLEGQEAYRLSCSVKANTTSKTESLKVDGVLFKVQRQRDTNLKPLVLKTKKDEIIWNTKLGWENKYGKQPLAYWVGQGKNGVFNLIIPKKNCLQRKGVYSCTAFTKHIRKTGPSDNLLFRYASKKPIDLTERLKCSGKQGKMALKATSETKEKNNTSKSNIDNTVTNTTKGRTKPTSTKKGNRIITNPTKSIDENDVKIKKCRKAAKDAVGALHLVFVILIIGLGIVLWLNFKIREKIILQEYERMEKADVYQVEKGPEKDGEQEAEMTEENIDGEDGDTATGVEDSNFETEGDDASEKGHLISDKEMEGPGETLHVDSQTQTQTYGTKSRVGSSTSWPEPPSFVGFPPSTQSHGSQRSIPMHYGSGPLTERHSGSQPGIPIRNSQGMVMPNVSQDALSITHRSGTGPSVLTFNNSALVRPPGSQYPLLMRHVRGSRPNVAHR